MSTIEILRVPSFEYSGFYYPEIASKLRLANRIYVPEITNEDGRELAIQLERSFALVGHYNNVLLDMVANEAFLDTARLPESVKLHLNLISYRMLPASPASVDVLGTLTRKYTSTTRLLEASRKFATRRTPEQEEVLFENAEVLDTTYRTDRISDAYSMTYNSKTGTCATSSLYPDTITRTAGSTFVTADIGKYLILGSSTLGNNTDFTRIVELLDETAPGSGIFNQVRLENTSFVSETGIAFLMFEVSTNLATDLATGLGATIYPTPPLPYCDCFYFGHADIMFDRFDVVCSAFAGIVEGRLEFYDPSETTINPDDVTVNPGGVPATIRFELTSLLGVERDNGAFVKVIYIPTGDEFSKLSEFSTINYVDIPSYLGQSTPSTILSDYLVYCDWRPVEILTDTTRSGSVSFGQDGYIKYAIPQSQSDDWQKFTIYNKTDGELRTAYYLRYRIVLNAGLAAGPALTSLVLTNATEYVLFSCVQGQSVEDDPLGSSDGTTSQEFTLSQTPYILNSIRLFVDEGGGDIEWTQVVSFLSSYSSDRHFMVDVQTDGSAIVIFGDGTNGRIPPVGVNNIRAVYRIGADTDGNVGTDTVTVNRDGSGVVSAITNPRAGEFWYEADWDSQEALERVKTNGPRYIQTMRRAVNAKDAEVLARAFRNTNGIKPVVRAKGYEEAFGPKTIELIVCGGNGAALTQVYKSELEEYFNGGSTYGGVLINNHELTATNYIPRLIGITVEVTAYSNVTEALVLQRLSALLSPTALEDDQTTYVWEFGQEVPTSRIIAEIFKISPNDTFKVKITSPSADVTLGYKELPLLDVVNTHIVMLTPTR